MVLQQSHIGIIWYQKNIRVIIFSIINIIFVLRGSMGMISMVLSTLIWVSVAVLGFRVITNSLGITYKNKKIAYICEDKGQHGGFFVTTKEVAAVFGIALLFRVIVFLLSAFAIFIVRDIDFSFNEWINTYMQWDAHNYHRIAYGGYSYHVENGAYTTLAFFPLYPILIRIVNFIFNNYIISGILVSGLLYSGACAFMYKLLAIDYNKQTTIRAIVYISVFPHALFFGVMMNESLLLFTAVATLYFIRKHNWPLVGIFGALAAMSRMAGLLLAIPAAVEWLEHYKIFDKLRSMQIKEVIQLFVKKGLWIFLMLFGTGVYLYCNYKTTGDWFKFFDYQKEVWHNGTTYFGKGISIVEEYMLKTTKFTLFSLWIPELLATVFTVIMLVYGIRKTRSMYTVFLVATIVLNTGLDWPISVARYMTCAVPAFVILSEFSERHKWTEPVITAGMAIAFGIFFVGYFMSRQIL